MKRGKAERKSAVKAAASRRNGAMPVSRDISFLLDVWTS
jgi:hypothetical protein